MTASNLEAGQTGVVLIIDEAQYFSFDSPATLTYTFPSSTSSTGVSWQTIFIGGADWQVSCASGG